MIRTPCHQRIIAITYYSYSDYLMLNNLALPLLRVRNVELVGFEPTSKQGNHTLSTRLFQPSVFVHWQDLDHQPMPYPLKFHSGRAGPRQTISDFSAPLYQLASEQQPLSDVSFHHLVTE